MISKKMLLLAAVLIPLLVVGAAYAAATYFYVPTDNNIIGDPLPTTSPTPTPSPTPAPNIIGGYLTANDTDTEGNYIFHKGDTLRLTCTLNVTGVDTKVLLYNNNVNIANTTSVGGVAVFDRVVNNSYNYYCKIENVQP